MARGRPSGLLCNVRFWGAEMLAVTTGMGAKPTYVAESVLSAFGLRTGKADNDLDTPLGSV
jgi:hypothetical protein